MRLSIGICAWNEADRIGPTIRSLFEQSLFQVREEGIESIEVVCLANGCTDDTAEVARAELEAAHGNCPLPDVVSWRVEEIEEGGLAHALNVLTHDCSDARSDFLYKLDADVRLIGAETLRELLRALEEDQTAIVAVPHPVKHIALKRDKTLMDRLSLRLSERRLHRKKAVPLTGALYCGRASVLREVWQPRGLRGTDHFLKWMIATDMFREEPDFGRIIRAPDATVAFQAYTTVRDMLYHQKRRAIARVMFPILADYLRRKAGPDGAGELIRRRNEEDKNWLLGLVEGELRTNRWWVLPSGARLQTISGHLRQPLWKVVLRFPVFCVEALVEWYALLGANASFRRGEVMQVWRRGQVGAEARTHAVEAGPKESPVLSRRASERS